VPSASVTGCAGGLIRLVFASNWTISASSTRATTPRRTRPLALSPYKCQCNATVPLSVPVTGGAQLATRNDQGDAQRTYHVILNGLPPLQRQWDGGADRKLCRFPAARGTSEDTGRRTMISRSDTALTPVDECTIVTTRAGLQVGGATHILKLQLSMRVLPPRRLCEVELSRTNILPLFEASR
jgi:hypothetical protein